MIDIDFNVDEGSFDRVTNSLNKLLDGNFRKPLTQIGYKLGEFAVRNINKGVDADGTPYEPLSEYTINNRTKQSDKPLNDNGMLLMSLTPPNSVNVTNDSLEVGTNRPGAEKNQYGDPNNMLNGKKAPIPKRSFLGIPPNFERVVTLIFNDYYNDILK